MPDRTLRDFSPDELRNMRIEDLTALRRDAIEAHVAAMPRSARLDAWAARMTQRHRSSVVGIGLHGGGAYFPERQPGERLQGAPVSWLAWLILGWHGENPDHWPAAWTDDHVTRAAAFEDRGKLFEGTRFVPVGG